MPRTSADSRTDNKPGLIAIMLLVSFLLLALAGYNGLKVKETIYEEIIEGNKLLADIHLPAICISESYLLVEEMLGERDSSKINAMIEQGEILRQSFESRQAYPEENLAGNSFYELANEQNNQPAWEFFNIREKEFIPAIISGDYQKAELLAHGILRDKYREQRLILDEAFQLTNEQNRQAEKKAHEHFIRNSWILLLLGIFFIAIAIHAWYRYKQSFEALSQLSEHLRSIAEGGGNLAGGLKPDSADKIGEIAGYFNRLSGRIKGMLGNIHSNSQELGISSAKLTLISQEISENSGQNHQKISFAATTLAGIDSNIADLTASITDTGGNINMIATAIEEMSGTTRNLASASEQTAASVSLVSELAANISKNTDALSESSRDVSDLVSNVAAAVKEINLSLNEININCERSIYITADASEKADDTNAIIAKLNNSSKQIEKIITVINDIADQTNMLALNAAIEAAGAGEAGKGFAVVANEVKELAKQTAEATEEIGQQIENMQFNMTGAVDAVATITEVVSEINVITNTIAAAVTEQSASTGEILNAVVKSSERVNLITKEISEIADNSQNTASGIAEASKGINEIARSATEISVASNEAAQNIDKVSLMFQNAERISLELSRESTSLSNSLEEISAINAKAASSADAVGNKADDFGQIAQDIDSLLRKARGENAEDEGAEGRK